MSSPIQVPRQLSKRLAEACDGQVHVPSCDLLLSGVKTELNYTSQPASTGMS